MATNYSRLFSRRSTPQSQPLPGSAQVPNSAGGFAWAVDDWQRLDRFLVLGAEGGTYYVAESDLVKQNHHAVVRCIRADGTRVVRRLVEVSDSGRAPRNDPAIFVLALATAHGDEAARAAAYAALPQVCRTGTHLFHFAEYANALRGWGRGLRKAVARWYLDRDPRDLALQVVKYQQRDGWSHADVLRVAHPRPADREHQAILRWVLTGPDALDFRIVKRRVHGVEREMTYAPVGALPPLLEAFETAKRATTAGDVVKLIRDFNLPREAVPTQWLNDVAVWDALLAHMPLTAIIRNLGKMTNLGLLKPFSVAAKFVVQRLTDETALRRARVHPLAVLLAQRTYAQGRGDKGSLKWTPVPHLVDALDAAFYAAFQNVQPVGRPLLLALDVSGSMVGSRIAGTSLAAREASAAMALVTAATEPEVHIVGFTDGLVPLDITPKQRLDDVLKRISDLPFGSTDCAQPMLYARRERLRVAGFVTFTDSETWAGNIHPSQALRDYRGEFAPDARAVVVGMTSNGFTLADPDDGGMLDVVGFDAAAPAVIADFLRS